jgi:diguanylate cyclase (GGDEF)-like protein
MPALIVLLVTAAVSFGSLQRFVAATDNIKTTLSIQRATSEVINTLLDAETGQRGYLITSDPSYLRPYELARDRIGGQLHQLLSDVAHNPTQLAKAERLKVLSEDKLRELAAAVSAHSRAGLTVSRQIVTANGGKMIMDQIRDVISAIQLEETNSLSDGRRKYRLTEWVAVASWSVFLAIALVVLAALYWLMGIERRHRDEAAADHARYVQELGQSMRSLEKQRDEIAKLNAFSDYLQRCETLNEVGDVVTRNVPSLVETFSGALYVSNGADQVFRMLSGWGSTQGPRYLRPDACWALRGGQSHGSHSDGAAPRCGHFSGDPEQTLCLPIIAHGEVLGLLALWSAEEPHADIDEVRRSGLMVARQLATTIANIELKQTLQDQALRDALTGSFNRRYLDIVGDKETSRGQREGRNVSLIILDLDHFKEYNDSFGHTAGDAALVCVANYLKKNIRECDWLFRYGGEEFVIILSNAGPNDASAKANELCAGISALSITDGDEPLPSITASIGSASCPQNGTTFKALLESADDALYISKSSGRNRVTIAGLAA